MCFHILGKIQYHTANSKTSEAVDLGSYEVVGGDKGIPLKLHASFMVIAWLLCANVGTYTARYCKNIFQVQSDGDSTDELLPLLQGKQILKADVWFRIHQICMSLAVIFSIAGIIPVLIEKKLEPIKDQKYHPLLGVTVLVIAFLQPIIAFFRPNKDAKTRPLFKFVHTFLGYSAIVIAIASVFLTNELQARLVLYF